MNLADVARGQEGGLDPRPLHGRLPDGLGRAQGARRRRLRRGHDRAPAASRTRTCSSSGAPGNDRPPRPCTFCNKCLFNLLESPLGCYDESRFDSREEMLREIYSVYELSVEA